MRFSFFIAFIFLLVGCQQAFKSSVDQTVRQAIHCVPHAQGFSAKQPCWLLQKSTEYIILSGNKHIGSTGWLQARTQLLREAIVELAIRRYGEEVSVDTQVRQEIKTNATTIAKKQTQVIRQLQFSLGKGKINIKAQMIDYYYHPPTEKVWVLVQEIFQ